MTKQELVRLINQEIDGTNSPAEIESLRAEMNVNAEARSLMEELRKLTAALESTRTVPPPATLKRGIMAGIQKQPKPLFHPAVHAPLLWLSRLVRKPSMTFASGLAVGVALVVLYFNVMPTHPFEPKDAAGTILLSPSSLQMGQTVDLRHFGLAGSLQTRYGDATGTIGLQIGDAGTRAEFRFTPGDLTLKGVVRGTDFSGEVVVTDGMVSADADKGNLTLVFTSREPGTAGVQVAITSKSGGHYNSMVTFRPGKEN